MTVTCAVCGRTFEKEQADDISVRHGIVCDDCYKWIMASGRRIHINMPRKNGKLWLARFLEDLLERTH